MKHVRRIIAFAMLSLLCSCSSSSTLMSFGRPPQTRFVWAMSDSGTGDLWRVDLTQSSPLLVGRLRVNEDAQQPGFPDHLQNWAAVTISDEAILYFIRRVSISAANGATSSVYSLDSRHPANSGSLNPGILNPTPLGQISFHGAALTGDFCGLCFGPDRNLYFVAINTNDVPSAQKPPDSALWRFYLRGPKQFQTELVGAFDGTVHFGGNSPGGNDFSGDLDFNPITGDLWGHGIDSNGRRCIYRIDREKVVGRVAGTNDLVHDQLHLQFEEVWPDSIAHRGLTFARNGDLYESAAVGGIFARDQFTGVVNPGYLGGTEHTVIGTDIAAERLAWHHPPPPPPPFNCAELLAEIRWRSRLLNDQGGSGPFMTKQKKAEEARIDELWDQFLQHCHLTPPDHAAPGGLPE